jgi:Tol biopolymer transport system component
MARVAEATRVAVASSDVDSGDRASARFAWLSVLLATWIILGLVLVSWALNSGRASDVGASPYHIPAYLGLATLGVFCVALVARAKRGGRRWHEAFPAGYGTLGAGILVILAFIVADVGWREGVGVARFGIENWLAPTRVLLVVGIFLIAVAPLRARLLSGPADGGPWPAVVSAGFVLALAWGASFHPAANPWLEHATIDPNSEIWVMDEDGAHQTRLIESGGGVGAWNAVLSPDGAMIAYSRLSQHDHPSGAIPGDADIWVAKADGSGARPLVVREGFQWLPHWSRDGAWIVFTDEPEGGPWMAAGPKGLEGGNGLLGLGFGAGSTTPARQYARIWRVRADGTGSPQQLTDSPGDDRAAAYSPDGKRLVFDSSRDGNTQIYVMDADGSKQRRLTQDDSDDWGAAWSPTGKQIAFNAAFSGEMQIYVLGVDSNEPLIPIALTSDPGTHITPSWSPDGSHLVFAFQGLGPRGECEIRSIEVSGAEVRNLTRSPGACEDLTSGGEAWGRDGRIVYQRGEAQAPNTDPLVREDLAAASVLLTALLVSIVAAVVIRIDPPFGTFAIVMAIATAFAASQSEQWRFLPAAVAGGLLVDVLVRLTPLRRRARVAGAMSAVAFVLGVAATVALTTALGWSPTLLLGVTAAGGVLGWVVGALLGPRLEVEPDALG